MVVVEKSKRIAILKMLTMEYLQDVGKRTAETLHGYFEDNNGWTVVKKTDDILVERRPSDCEGFSHGFLYRGKCEYNCPKETVYRYVDPQPGDSLRKKWDIDMKEIQLLKFVDQDIRIIRTTTNSAVMGLISPRDFTDIMIVTKTENAIINAGQSIKSEEWPADPKFVRGWNYPCGLVCMNIPGKPNTTRLITFIQPDIRGSLPASLIQSAIPNSMLGFFSNLKKILIKDGHISKK